MRSRKVKTFKEIQKLNDNSTEIFAETMIDNYYPERPTQLEGTCLFDFVRNYDIKKRPNRSTYANDTERTSNQYALQMCNLKPRNIPCY